MKLGKDEHFVMCALLLIMSHPIYRCLCFIFGLIHLKFANNMNIIWGLIIIYTVYILAKEKMRSSHLFALLGTYSFYALNYFISSASAKYYYTQSEVMCVLIFYVPVSILIISRNLKWNILFKDRMFLNIIDFIIIASLLSKITGLDSTNYMSFSYDLLPAWCITATAAIVYKKTEQWIFFAFGIFEGIIYGARGPILWLAIYLILICFILVSSSKKINFKYIIGFISVILLAFVFINTVIPYLLNTSYSQQSYVLKRIQFGSLTDDSNRSVLYEICKSTIINMGINVYGLFYDRTILPGNMYSHNFIYEILISFGWFFGIFIITLIAYFIIRSLTYSQTIEKKISAVFLICSLFLRYTISGSVFDEGNFVIFIIAIVMHHSNIKPAQKTLDDNKYY